MGNQSFHKGVEFFIENTEYVILKNIYNGMFQIENTHTGIVKNHTLDELHHLYINSELKFKNAIKFTNKKESNFENKLKYLDFTDEQWEKAKVRRLYVKECMLYPNSKTKLQPVIQAIWDKIKKPKSPPYFTTVIRWKKRYISSGEDISALVERNDRKGKTKAYYSKEIVSLVTESINKLYLKREPETINDVLGDVIRKIDIENNLLPSCAKKLPYPSYNYIKTRINKIPAFDRCVAIHGHTEATKRFMHVKRHIQMESVLERAEIDHTPMDLMVIHNESMLPLGRPLLTLVMDCYSRCVLGIYIGFEEPSYLSVSHCLRHALTPKTNLKKEYPSIENEWCSFGVMQELVVDNGFEFHSKSLEHACLTLGIEIHYAARKKGWMKPFVERLLGHLNKSVSHGTKGTTFSNIFQKGDYDPSKHAIVTLDTLKEVINKWIVDYYHQKPHSSLGTTPEIIWKSKIRQEDIQLPDDLDYLNVMLARTYFNKRLSHKGIEHDCLFYNCDELGELRRQKGEKLLVDIKVDESDISHIHVISPDENNIIKVPALKQEYTKGLSTYQNKLCREYSRKHYNRKDPNSYLRAKHAIREIVNKDLFNAKKRTRKNSAKYDNSGTKNKLETENSTEKLMNEPITNSEDSKQIVQQNKLTQSNLPNDRVKPGKVKKKKTFKAQYREREQESINLEHIDE